MASAGAPSAALAAPAGLAPNKLPPGAHVYVANPATCMPSAAATPSA